MRPSTEDLLSARDGEPLGPEERAAIGASPECAHEVERLTAMQRSLQALPEVEPPADGWQRVLAAEHARHALRRRAARTLAGAGIAAALTLVALIVLVTTPAVESDRAAFIADRLDRRSPPAGTYVALLQESARLERLLAEIPRQGPVMTLRTASTIVGIEDQIALLDEQLSYADAVGLREPQREALWSERVELMNALLMVRAAQAPDRNLLILAGGFQ